MKLHPTGSRVLVKQEKEYKTSIIIQPEAAEKRSLMGEVIAIGPEVLGLDVGDHVWYGLFSGAEVPFGDFKLHKIMNEEDIIGKIEKEEGDK